MARYILRASFSQERMKYLEQEGTVVYTAKDKIHDPPNIEYAPSGYLAHAPQVQTDAYTDPEIEDSAKLIFVG